MEFVKLDPYPSITAGGKFSLSVNELQGRTVYGLQFIRGGTTFDNADLLNLEVRAGQKPILPKVDGAELKLMNDYQGISAVSNYDFVWFGDPTAATVKGQWIGGLDLSLYGADPLQITGEVHSSASAPTLETWAMVGPPKELMELDFTEEEAALVRALIPTVLSPSASVDRQSQQVGIGSRAGGRIRQIHFHHANLTSVEWRKNNEILHEDLSDAQNDAWQTSMGRSPQTGLYVVDRILNGQIGNAETTLQPNGQPWPQSIMISTSGSDTIQVYADVLAALSLI